MVKLIEDKIRKEDLVEIGQEFFEDMIKAVADIERGIMAVGGELHSDGADILIKNGSSLADLWGINIYFNEPRERWIEFNSLINIKPGLGNRSTGVEDPKNRERIKEIVNKLVQ